MTSTAEARIGLLFKRSQAKVRQTLSRAESGLRGSRGRAEHKGKAQTTNKPSGGKMAR